MSREIYTEILSILSSCPEGLSFKELSNRLKAGPPERTLHRRLNELISSHRIVAEGTTRNRCYKIAESKPLVDHPESLHIELTHQKSLIPLSNKSTELLNYITQPIQKRQPVGYNRTFLESYQPNITFYLTEDMRRFLRNKGDSSEIERPAGTYAKKIFHRLLVDLSWNSSRLEGNTYSLLETKRLIEDGELTAGKDKKDAQMILNHKSAIEFLIESAEVIGVDRYTIFNLHALLSNQLLSDSKFSGALRAYPVKIAGTTYLPLEVPFQIAEYFDEIIYKARAIEDPFEQAFFLMVHLPYLQPFEDVNKRVSRLAVNLPLIRFNFCPLSFIDVPEDLYISGLLAIYECNRVELLRDIFVWAYERSCDFYMIHRQMLSKPDPFKFKYQRSVGRAVFHIVHNNFKKAQVKSYLQDVIFPDIPIADRKKYLDYVLTELDHLHEGNIARYKLDRKLFAEWEKNWV